MDEQNQTGPLVPNEPRPGQPQVVEPQWQYQSGNLAPTVGYVEPPAQDPSPALGKQATDSESTEDSIHWSASEFISTEKNRSWYLLVALGAVVLAAIIYLLTKEVFSVIIIILLGLVFGVFGSLKPRVLEYYIGPEGIQVGNKQFTYEEFRSFSIIEEGVVPSVLLLPHKRLMVPMTMYLDPVDSSKVINILGDFLPLEQRKPDIIDRISSKLRF